MRIFLKMAVETNIIFILTYLVAPLQKFATLLNLFFSPLSVIMYKTVWAKYLPVIRIILKKSLTSDQVLALNIPDFERAGMTRKSGYKFMIRLKNGKPGNVIIDSPLASGLISALQEDNALQELIGNNEFHISMNPKFELSIKHLPKEELVEEKSVESEND